MRKGWINIVSITILVAILSAMGTMLLGLNDRQFEAQANMVTQEQLRQEFVYSNDRIDERLNSIETMVRIMFKQMIGDRNVQ